jgi:adenosylhomocysteine nucleosidase
MIGIIGAIDHELTNFFHEMLIERTEIIADKTFYIGKIHNHEVTLVKSGVGKVNAAITTTLLIKHFNSRMIINSGVAGGIKPMKIGDIILTNGISYFDVSLTAIDDIPYGKMGSDPLVVNTDEHLLAKAEKVFKELGYEYQIGKVVSGDKFVTRDKDLRKIMKHVDNVLGVEMEGMAIAITAHKFDVPFLSIRGVSDIINTTSQSKVYREVVKEVAEKTTKFVISFLGVVDE